MTNYTQLFAAAFPLSLADGIVEAIEARAEPESEIFFSPTATHTDEKGDPWQYVQASARPHMVALLSELSDAFPAARFAIIGELQRDVPEGTPVHWRAGEVAMVDLGGRDAVLEGLEPIVEEL